MTPQTRSKLIKRGFLAAAAMNFGGVLLFSRGLTNEAIPAADPVVMSTFGLLMILVWGLAYIGGAYVTSGVRWLASAFAIEKLVYVIAWIHWQMNNALGAVFEADLFAGIFYSIYGINDLVFMLFFAWVFFTASEPRTHQ